MTPDVTFQPLSDWQKRDCINQATEFTCGNDAVQEAVIFEGSIQAVVRCCTDSACKARASELARIQFEAFQKTR